MNILYIERGIPKASFSKTVLRRIKRYFCYGDQDGFFEQSLDTVAHIKRIGIKDVYKEQYNKQYDLLLINWKQPGCSSEHERFLAIKKILAKAKIPSALFINAAKASYLPSEDVLDLFQHIIKREPYKNLDRYPISKENRAKIIPTIIHCPFYPSFKPGLVGALLQKIKRDVACKQNTKKIYDVSFSGADAAEHTLRRDAWRRVVQEKFFTIGGLQSNPYTKEMLPAELSGERLAGRAYQDSLCQAKINLALAGIGEYTFRHQELLYLGQFILSSGSIRDQNLVIPLEENVHYVAFDTFDEMVEKIRYYTEHEIERHTIAAAGKKLFTEYYDPKRHGQELLARLKSA